LVETFVDLSLDKLLAMWKEFRMRLASLVAAKTRSLPQEQH
jgi:hypothetical protein